MKRVVEQEDQQRLGIVIPQDVWHHFARCMLAWVECRALDFRPAFRFLIAVGNRALADELKNRLYALQLQTRCAQCYRDLMTIPLRMHKFLPRRSRLASQLAVNDKCESQLVLSIAAEVGTAIANGFCHQCANGNRCLHCGFVFCPCLRRYSETCVHCRGTTCGRCASEWETMHRSFMEEVDPRAHCAACCRDPECRQPAYPKYI